MSRIMINSRPIIGIENSIYQRLCEEKFLSSSERYLPKKYIINDNATILFWGDGTKTVVKRCKGESFNKRIAFLTAYFQHYSGLSKSKANKYLANLVVEKPKRIKVPKYNETVTFDFEVKDKNFIEMLKGDK